MMNPIRFFQAWVLSRKQADLNKEYEKYGLTDEILDKQVEINNKRLELDIPDENNLIDETFVQ